MECFRKSSASQLLFLWISAAVLAACGFSSSSTVASSVSSTAVTTSTTLPNVKLSNFGATIQSWNLSHTLDPNNPNGYWPRLSDGRDTYSALNIQDGVVLGFTFALTPSIPLKLASALARDFMPPSTVVVATKKGALCTVEKFSKFLGHDPYAAFILDSTGNVKSILFGVDNVPSGC
ncbi:MAG: hypothetical protein M0Z45_08860 [Actinomycetota bacterium]|nr:hypothetical protein [Actinomycetota bacterium]